MATERLPMRHIREILRLKWGLKRSHREAARRLGISAGAVASVLSRASKLGLTWEALGELTDDALEQRLYGPRIPGRVVRRPTFGLGRVHATPSAAPAELPHQVVPGRGGSPDGAEP